MAYDVSNFINFIQRRAGYKRPDKTVIFFYMCRLNFIWRSPGYAYCYHFHTLKPEHFIETYCLSDGKSILSGMEFTITILKKDGKIQEPFSSEDHSGHDIDLLNTRFINIFMK